jgi:hypothetical protein
MVPVIAQLEDDMGQNAEIPRTSPEYRPEELAVNPAVGVWGNHPLCTVCCEHLRCYDVIRKQTKSS